MDDISIVEYFNHATRPSDCGYCKSDRTYFSRGMWAHSLAVKDYQNLIDRGWRRSGHYCYQPNMSITCCPMYTIRLEIQDLELSRSQKKVLKRFNKFLRNGDTPKHFSSGGAGDGGIFHGGEPGPRSIPTPELRQAGTPSVLDLDIVGMDGESSQEGQGSSGYQAACASCPAKAKPVKESPVGEIIYPLLTGESGVDRSKIYPFVLKAKARRLQFKVTKLVSRGMSEEDAKVQVYRKKPEVKKVPIEDYFHFKEDMSQFAHKIQIKLVPVSEVLRDQAMMDASYNLYKRYQTAIHHDEPDQCTKSQFQRFLVDSPLCYSHYDTSPPCGVGSFHQQYWLDGQLKAVGVIDILTKCVSSVYFFYDPELRCLSFGTLGSLQEISFARSLTPLCQSLKYYYLGYYIHSCPKMSYKANYIPSYLLCPETFTWHRLGKCIPKIEESKYSRLEPNPNVPDKHCSVDLSKVMVLHKNSVCSYEQYLKNNPNACDEREVEDYAVHVGSACYPCLLLYRK